MKRKIAMGEVVKYITDHFLEDLQPEQVAKYLGYSNAYFLRKFTSYFGISFSKYIKMLRLRRAAEEILEQDFSIKNISRKYKYTSIESFSKAFHKEFGMSPTKFKEEEREVPDMPLRPEINGHALEMSYVQLANIVLDGRAIEEGPVSDFRTAERVSWIFQKEKKKDYLNGKEDWYGFWWCDNRLQMYYIMGTKSKKMLWDEEDAMRIKVGGGDYAAFYVHRKTTDTVTDIIETQKALATYILEEWKVENLKIIDGIRFVFEKFEGDEAEARSYIKKRL